ncbi:hypothetical protein HNP24_001540 [Chryseobacterium sediminis]|uniref:DUF4848 domain-containing protein n=1 Tax=Chryseobacterium sediminis TaxID=1679494 RepID=A0ABR6PXZ0_9FLAO|nr:hypothetical protein [Chryseobacterium sediminis]MBB6330590.1 hypothetical protein [Chryseobacterium sediminis]
MKTKINFENIEPLYFNSKKSKTFVINSFLLMIISLFSLACQKSIDDINDSPIEKKNFVNAQKTMNASPEKMLYFATLDEYENFFNNSDFANLKIETTDYSPLRNTIEEINKLVDSDTPNIDTNPIMEDAIYDNYGLLLDILNQKKLVRLGNYIVRVDLANNAVYTIPFDTPDAVNTILNKPENEFITQYDNNTELVPILFNLFSCNDRWAIHKKEKLDDDRVNCSNRKRTKKELTYQAAGIYFSIVGEAKGQKKVLIWVADNYQYPDISYFSYTLKKRCGSSESWGGDPDSWSGSLAWSSDGNKATFRPYQSTYALKEYNVYANIVGCRGTHTLHIEDY